MKRVASDELDLFHKNITEAENQILKGEKQRMDDLKEILAEPISTAELQRRWEEVRKKMKEEEIDFLVMQNDNEWLGGYVK